MKTKGKRSIAIYCMSSGYKNVFTHGVLKAFEDNGFRASKRAYATTRMLHAWNIPAFINNHPYLDGSYTSLCPVASLAVLGYKEILCIVPEKDKVVYDLFSDEEIPSQIEGSVIEFIKPDRQLREMGVDFYTLTSDGLDEVYSHGYEKGLDYLKTI